MIRRGKGASTNKRILGRSEFKDGKLDLPGPLAQPPRCPERTSQKVWKDGLRKTRHNDVKRWLCRDCGYRFSQNESRDSAKPLQEDSCWSINTASTYTLPRQVCELLTEDSKKLAKVQSRTEKQAAGATNPDNATLKGKIIELAFKLNNQGYSKATIINYTKNLDKLAKRGANFFDPENVKEVIAQQESWNEATKSLAVAAYAMFAGLNNIKWELPKYKQKRKIPFIPLESEIDALISGCGKKTATLLQLLKETGMRPGEACSLTWRNIDIERTWLQ